MPQKKYIGPSTKWAAFTDKHAHPLLLDLILLKEFGTEYLGWDASTVWMEIEKTFGIAPSEVNRSKIQALRTCHVTDAPYTRWEVFEKVAVGLDGGAPRFDLIQKPSGPTCALALDIMASVRNDVPVSQEVYKYVAAVLHHNGTAYGPGVLSPVNRHLKKLVGPDLVAKVKMNVDRGHEPQFDGINDVDVQVYKSVQISEYVDFHNKMVLAQMKRVLGGTK